MRAILILALAGRCAADGREAGPPPAVTGIHIETGEGDSTGDPDMPRLDLGAWEPWTTGESTGGSTGGEESTGEPALPTTSGASTGDPGTSTGGGSTSTGVDDTSTGAASTSGTTGEGTSTGGDSTTGEPLTDCPCTDGADNVCDLAPGTCSATLPGGLCDPEHPAAILDARALVRAIMDRPPDGAMTDWNGPGELLRRIRNEHEGMPRDTRPNLLLCLPPRDTWPRLDEARSGLSAARMVWASGR